MIAEGLGEWSEETRSGGSDMAMEVDIAIVGGGLGGLALALGLQERGIQAHIFEKAPKLRVHTGTAISLGLNGNILEHYPTSHLFGNSLSLEFVQKA